ncbi:MAG: ethanolamine ammonia-lyase reactivating factor EutA [Candidatus Heimdallarchaeaceae archaeon]
MNTEPVTLTLLSAGIDVGTTTSHLIFSRLTLEKIYTPKGVKFEVTKREIIYKGNIILTPLIDGTQIDYIKLVEYLKNEYRLAGISADSVDTGAVIITGESAKKENAEDLVKALAHKAGNFVCAVAGPNFESVIAAMGSGAVQYSKEAKKVVMNIDIGGGTSNIAIIDSGEICATSCINVGGRLLAFNDDNEIIRIEPPIKYLEDKTGINFDYGMRIQQNQKQEIAKILASSLFELIQQRELSELTKKLLMTPALSYHKKVDIFVFSGGVAEYIYDNTVEDYNDLGKYLGLEIKQLINKTKISIQRPKETIRATVIGAGQYTLQVSGVTTHISDADLLPLYNLPVIVPKIDLKNMNQNSITEAILRSLQLFDINEGSQNIALAFKGAIGGSYASLTTFVKGVASALKNTIKKSKPIIMIFDQDIGNSVGNVMKRETKAANVISIDEIIVNKGDFIDIGKPRADGQVVPVVVKTLVFSN